jgi:hypothetical protein
MNTFCVDAFENFEEKIMIVPDVYIPTMMMG